MLSLTGQTGFILGTLIGLTVYFVSIGQITFTPAQTDAVQAAKSLMRTLAIASTIITVLLYARRKSLLGTTVEGFIMGFATVVDLITIWGT